MSKKIIIVLIFALTLLYIYTQEQKRADRNAPSTVAKDTELEDAFSEDVTLEETGKIEGSKSRDWRVSSGAFLIAENGVGRTVQGELPEQSKWQVKYAANNPEDTDNGFHPQNIFRLVTINRWQDYTQEAYFKIKDYHTSEDAHRSESNGLFLFNRYQDENNLYYTGLRVDGTASIKKKLDGVYYTMKSKQIFMGKYDRDSNPNLLPQSSWIGIRCEVTNSSDNTVDIKLYVDRERSGDWQLVAEAKDDGKSFGGKAIFTEGNAGIRTDFMDAEFDDYRIIETD